MGAVLFVVFSYVTQRQIQWHSLLVSCSGSLPARQARGAKRVIYWWIRRTGIGETPPPETAGALLGLLAHPATLRMVTVVSPLPMTSTMNTCRKPTTVTCPVAGLKEAGSVLKIGRVATELLVVTNFPDSGPLRAVISMGPVLERKFAVLSVSCPGSWIRHCTPLRVSWREVLPLIVISALVGIGPPVVSTVVGRGAPHE